MFRRQNIAAVAAEFLGAFALASAVLAMAARTGFPFFAAVAAGVTLAVLVLVIGPISGAQVNPAVTFGLWSLRKVATSRAIVYIAAQLLGGFTALRVNEYLLNQSLADLAHKNWDVRVFVAEALGTAIFTFGIAAAVYNAYEGGRLSAAIGASLFVGILIATFGSNGALNPAVALGINSWSTSYMLGPIVGALVGMNLYAVLCAPVSMKAQGKKNK